jgi:hypothetical protein
VFFVAFLESPASWPTYSLLHVMHISAQMPLLS